MSNNSHSVFELAAREMGIFLDPLVNACENPNRLFDFFAERGWRLEGLLGADLTPITQDVDAVRMTLQNLSEAGDADSLDGIANMLAAFGSAFESIRNLQASISGLAIPGIDESVAHELAADLLEYLILWYVAARAPILVQIARVLTIVDDQLPPVLASSTGDILRLPLYRPTLLLGNLAQLLRNPIGHLKQAYLAKAEIATEADARAFAEALFPHIDTLVYALGGTARSGLSGARAIDLLDPANEPLQRMMTLLFPVGPIGSVVSDDSPGVHANVGSTIAIIPATGTASFGPQGPGLEIDPVGLVSFEMPLGRWTVNIKAGGQIGKMFVNGTSVRFADLAANSVDLAIALSHNGGQEPGFLIGAASGTRLEIGSFRLIGEVRFHNQELDFGILVEIVSAAFVIAGGDGDGFLQKILPENLRMGFDLALGWSNYKGLYFRGSAGLEATLPNHLNLLGVLKVDSIFLALRAKDVDNQAAIEMVIAASASIKLGPIIANVDRIGLLAKLTFPKNGGNLGQANLALDFKPPEGAGLSIDAAAIVGGGYLFFDPANEQYAGILQLEIKGGISLKAIGLLTTRLPGLPPGTKGFSLLVIISAEFPPIQLGFGFTLNGVGGLLGVNRTMVLDVLQSGIKNHTLDSVLFPQNPVANAAQIISDLQSIFPPVTGQYVFGPMAKLAWGTPTILTIDLGIVLEFPSPLRLAIMGQLRMVLPSEEVEEELQVVVIRMDVLGAIDFDKSDASIDATLYDSRVAQFVISGDMAMRLNWGASPVFALSAGGFNPRFQPPPNFPSLDRLSIALATGDNPRIRLEAYLALTTNTIQFGARLDAYAKANLGLAGDFTASAYLGFDVLVYRSPLSFIADIEGYVCVKGAGQTISGWLYLSLSGPLPWHAYGKAIVEIMGKHHIRIDVTIGNEEPPAPLPPGDPLADLRVALADRRNWSAQLPADGHMLVTLRKIPISENSPNVLMHPFGELTFRQKAVPLDTAISMYGSTTPVNPGPFTITDVLFNDQSTQGIRQTVRDLFAPGQFFELSDDEKLSRPSFESLPSGCTRISTNAISPSTSTVTTEFQYDTVVIDNKEKLISRRGKLFEYTVDDDVLLAIIGLGAAGQSAMRSTGARKFAGSNVNRVSVQDPEYIVASKEDMTGEDPKHSYTEAEAARRSRGAESERYQIVGKHEVA